MATDQASEYVQTRNSTIHHDDGLRSSTISLSAWFKWLPVLDQLGRWHEDKVCPLSSADIDSQLCSASVPTANGYRQVRFYWAPATDLDIITHVTNGVVEIMACILHDHSAGKIWASTKTLLRKGRLGRGPIYEWNCQEQQIVACYGDLLSPFSEEEASLLKAEMSNLLSAWPDSDSDSDSGESDNILDDDWLPELHR